MLTNDAVSFEQPGREVNFEQPSEFTVNFAPSKLMRNKIDQLFFNFQRAKCSYASHVTSGDILSFLL